MSTKIARDISTLEHSAELELFVLDATMLGGSIMRFHGGTNELMQPVVWQDETYQPFPIEADGFKQAADGPLARPVLRISNVYGLIGVLIREYRGLKGAKLTRKRTLAKYLDAVNFAAGNPHADPYAEYPDDVWSLDRQSRRDKLLVEYELASAMDVAGVMLPRRQIIAASCVNVRYRGPDCGYTGPPVAKADDTPTSDAAQDQCSHSLTGCKLRWGTAELPFGGFPGAGVVRQV
jgi:lambda family phage minor tail protein L